VNLLELHVVVRVTRATAEPGYYTSFLLYSYCYCCPAGMRQNSKDQLEFAVLGGVRALLVSCQGVGRVSPLRFPFYLAAKLYDRLINVVSLNVIT